MCHFHLGCKQHAAAARANGCAEIDVFQIHEEPLVEAADGLGVAASHEQTRADSCPSQRAAVL